MSPRPRFHLIPSAATIAVGVTQFVIAQPAATGWSSSDPSVATVDGRGAVLGIAPGVATIRAFRRSETATMTITVEAVEIPPIDLEGYGPRADVTQPSGSIGILPGPTSIQAAVANHPTGTVFWLTGGLYELTQAITPKSGQSFIGAPGAVLTGAGWSSSDPTQAAFRAHNETILDVTIRNLVIRLMPQKGIHAFRDFASGWTVEACEVAGCKDGISLSTGAIVRDCSIHHNIGDPENADPGLRGGGYVFNEGSNLLLEHNEIAYNGPEQKSINIQAITWRNNFVHHNHRAGIWIDGDGLGSVIEDNRVEDQTVGIWYEAARGGAIFYNAVRRHTEQGIFLSTSYDTTITGNLLELNAFSVHAFVDRDVVGLYAWGADLRNNAISGNTIRVSAGQYGALFSSVGSGVPLTPYADNSKLNVFSDNAYHVAALDAAAWLWITPQTWAAWQALPQDAGSILEVD